MFGSFLSHHTVLFSLLVVVYCAGCGKETSENNTENTNSQNPGSQPVTSDAFDGDDLSFRWEIHRNGCTVEARDGALRIQGTVTEDGWEDWSGVESKTTFAEGDFTVSVDFRVPEFDGAGHRLVVLDAREVSGDQTWVSLFHTVGTIYGMNSGPFENPTPETITFAKSNLPPFGDEREKFHRLKLVYDSEAKKISSFVDDKRVATLDVELLGGVVFTLRAGTEKAGAKVDLIYDNFQYQPTID